MIKEYLYRFVRAPDTEGEYRNKLQNIIQKGYIHLLNPSKLNDPFDCKSCFCTKGATFEDLRTYFESTINKYQIPINGRYIDIDDLMKEISSTSTPEIAAESLKSHFIHNQQEMLNKYGILCFVSTDDTEYPTNTLMWSHYANGHTGLCLQFCKKTLTERYICKPVDYKKTLPAFKDIALKDGEQLAELLLFRKSICWEYENEWRILELMSRSIDGFLHLPPEALTGIIFGCESNPAVRNDILAWARDREGIPLQLLITKKHPEEYKIVFERIE